MTAEGANPPTTEPRRGLEPRSTGDLRGLLLDYLDFYRSVVAAKVEGLGEGELRVSRLPSGWTPAGMLTHLVHMEQRWLVWGFLAEPVDEPWGDRADGPGWVDPDATASELVARLHAGGRRTREIVEAHPLAARAAVGGRFGSQDEAPLLQWILLHVLQEYARHAGHLDIVRELVDGSTGEEG